MNKHIKRTIVFILIIVMNVANFIVVSAENTYNEGFITICNIEDYRNTNYRAIEVNGEIYVSSDDIAEIINLEAVYYPNEVTYTNSSRTKTIDVNFDGSIWTRGITYESMVHNVDGTYFFPLEKLLYLSNAQWCVENNIIYVQLTENTILDFIEKYSSEIIANNITQTDLLINGESELSNAIKSSFAAIFNDFDIRIFVPIWGEIAITTEDYQNAMLQLARDELEFIDEYGQMELNDLLNKSDFSQIKSVWSDMQAVADLTKDSLTAIDDVNKTYLCMKDAKNGTNLFSEYNNLADLTPPEIGAISKELEGVSNILTITNALVNINEIANRSKSWNEDFLSQIELLTNFNEAGYNKSMVFYIKKASTSLLEEHSDTFSATIDTCVEETLKILGEELVDLTPAGTLTSIISTSLSIAKIFDPNFATTLDALELSNMVEWLIRIEYVAFEELSRCIQALNINALKGGSTLTELTTLRNTTMLALRTNLRNKVFIYYLNKVRNKDASWIYSQEAKGIKQDILWNYAKIIELTESKPLDRLLVIDSFENMYSNEYGCKRDKIPPTVLSIDPIINTMDNNPSRTNYYDHTGKLVYYESYAYYDNGLLCSSTLHSVDYHPNGKPYFGSLYTFLYLYDENGNLTNKILDSLTISDWYDKNTGEIILGYEYDGGNSTKINIYPLKESIDQTKFGVDPTKTEKIYGDAPIINTNASNEWTTTYLNNVFSGDEPTDMTSCRLIYVDNNIEPELWMDYGYGYAGDEVYTHNNTTLDKIFISQGSAKWLEKENLILISGGHMDSYYDEVFKIENGKFVSLGSGSYDIQYNGDSTISHYYWNSNEVTATEYEKHINELFLKDKAADINQNEYTYEQCKLLLQSITSNSKANELTDEESKTFWEIANKVYCTWVNNFEQMQYIDKQDCVVLPNDDLGDITYYRVKHNNINSVQSLKGYLQNYFSENVCNDIISFYRDYNGNLYYSGQGYGTENSAYGEITIKKQANSTATIIVQFIDSMSETTFEVEHNLTIENDKWVFADFVPCYIYDINNDNLEEDKNTNIPTNISTDIKNKIIQVCEQKYADLDGTLVIFDGEITETDEHFLVVVRIQRNNANSGANQLFADVQIEKSTGKMYINNEYVETLW